jgi:hypothetical protein
VAHEEVMAAYRSTTNAAHRCQRDENRDQVLVAAMAKRPQVICPETAVN